MVIQTKKKKKIYFMYFAMTGTGPHYVMTNADYKVISNKLFTLKEMKDYGKIMN